MQGETPPNPRRSSERCPKSRFAAGKDLHGYDDEEEEEEEEEVMDRRPAAAAATTPATKNPSGRPKKNKRGRPRKSPGGSRVCTPASHLSRYYGLVRA
jgi:hypothetical protein